MIMTIEIGLLVVLVLLALGSTVLHKQITKIHQRLDMHTRRLDAQVGMITVNRALLENLNEREVLLREAYFELAESLSDTDAAVSYLVDRVGGINVIDIPDSIFDTSTTGSEDCWSPDPNNFDEYDDQLEWKSYLASHPDAIRCSDIASDTDPWFGDLTGL